MNIVLTLRHSVHSQGQVIDVVDVVVRQRFGGGTWLEREGEGAGTHASPADVEECLIDVLGGRGGVGGIGKAATRGTTRDENVSCR